MKHNVIAWAALVVSTGALLSSQNLTRTVPAAPKMPAESQKTARALSDAFVSVSEFSKPSVVQVIVRKKSGNSPRIQGNGRGLPPGLPRGNGAPKDLEEFLKEMQKRFNAPDFGPEPQQFGGIAQGTGSGFVYDDHGHILTNNHVVSDAAKIVVVFHDGVEAAAQVVGTDPKSDVAVIKVETTSYPPLPMGVSAKVRVGELVMAVGSPFGLSQTVTMGIVSATERNDLGINDANDAYESFLQTDAPINPGNSGGPLVDMDGRVIGINSAIMTGGRSGLGGGGNDGVGFAIPIDLASQIADKLIKSGKVDRARIGVAIGGLSPTAAKILGIDPKIKGALVQGVLPGSPADKAGLKEGDVIVGFNNQPVVSVSNFRLTVAASEIGKPYSLKYFREGKERSTEVTLGSSEKIVFDQEKQSESSESPAAKAEEPAKTAINDFGIEVQPLTPELAKGLGLEKTDGVLVSSVKEDSPAAASGLKAGMVITQVSKDKKLQTVTSVKEFKEITDKSDDLMIHVKSSEIPGTYLTLSKPKKD